MKKKTPNKPENSVSSKKNYSQYILSSKCYGFESQSTTGVAHQQFPDLETYYYREKCKAYYNQESKFGVKKKEKTKQLIMKNPARTMHLLKIFNFENYNIAEVGKYALIFHIISGYHHDQFIVLECKARASYTLGKYATN